MSYKSLCVCAAVVLLPLFVSAQAKPTMSGKCGKSDVQQSVPAGDQQDHTFMVASGKCSVTGEVNGVKATEGSYAEDGETTGSHFKNTGVYTVTFENGDKIFYSYHGNHTMKNGAMQTGTNSYQVMSGTGKMKGVKGSGHCKLTGDNNGGLTYSCMGEYSTGGKAPMKK